MKKKVHALLEPHPTPATLFTTPSQGPQREPKETQSISRQTMMDQRVAFLTPVQSPGPQNISHAFTHQMHLFTKHRNSNSSQKLLREPTSTRKHRCQNTPHVISRPSPICMSHPPPASPWSSPPSPPPLPEAAPSPPHALSAKQNAAACVHSAARGSTQSGTLSLAAQGRVHPPAPVTLCTSKPRKGENEMERDNSLPAKSRCHKKLVWDSQTFAVMGNLLEDFFRLLRVTKIKKKVRELRAPPPTPATLFTTPAKGPNREPKEGKSPLSTEPRRQEVLHLRRRCRFTTPKT